MVNQAINGKAKAAWQVSLLVQKNDARYPRNYGSLKNKKSKDQKNSEMKKNHPSTTKIIAKIEASLVKVWSNLTKKILVSMKEISKSNFLTAW